MTIPRIDRLTILATFLRTVVPPTQFDLNDWVKNFGHATPESHVPCGFVGCAWGWAIMVPEFRADGLFLADQQYRNEKNDGAAVCYYDRDHDIEYDSSADAAAAFLGLTNDQINFLFMPSSYPKSAHGDPSAIAARIDLFVALAGNVVACKKNILAAAGVPITRDDHTAARDLFMVDQKIIDYCVRVAFDKFVHAQNQTAEATHDPA